MREKVQHFASAFALAFSLSNTACVPKAGQSSQVSTQAALAVAGFEAWAQQTHSIELDIYAPPNDLESMASGALRWYSPERLDRLIRESEKCLDSAFAAAGYPRLALRFNVNRFTYLKSEEFARLPTEPPDLPLDHQGKLFAQRGCDTEHFPLYFQKKISQPLYVNPDDAAAVDKARQYSEIRRCLGEKSACSPEITKMKQCEREKVVRNYGMNVALNSPPAAAVLLANDVFILPIDRWGDALAGKMTNAEITNSIDYEREYFAHEVLHVYAGLRDRYHNPAYYDQTNLMGPATSWTCKLSADQVRSMYHFRKTCTLESKEHMFPDADNSPTPCAD